MFRNASRINHDCESNAHNTWNQIIQRYTVHALRDIEPGEEITINYTCYRFCLYTREERQRILREKYAFTYSCRLYSLPPKKSQEHDAMVVRWREEKNRVLEGLDPANLIMDEDDDWSDDIESSDDDVAESLDGDDGLGRRTHRGSDKPRQDCTALLWNVEEAIRSYTDQGLDVALPEAFEMAAAICALHGDVARATVLYQRAGQAWETIEGADGDNAVQCHYVSLDPHEWVTGVFSDWETTSHDIPAHGNLDSDTFQAWLWRKRVTQTVEPLPNQNKQPATTTEPDQRTESRETPALEGTPVSKNPGLQRESKITPAPTKTKPTGQVQPQQFADFRNFKHFPTVGSLPQEDELNLRYYREKGLAYQPKHHWCFLGQKPHKSGSRRPFWQSLLGFLLH